VDVAIPPAASWNRPVPLKPQFDGKQGHETWHPTGVNYLASPPIPRAPRSALQTRRTQIRCRLPGPYAHLRYHEQPTCSSKRRIAAFKNVGSLRRLYASRAGFRRPRAALYRPSGSILNINDELAMHATNSTTSSQ